MVKVYEGAERWQKSRKVSDKFELHNDRMALRTAIKVIASDGEISIDQRDEMLDYFWSFSHDSRGWARFFYWNQ